MAKFEDLPYELIYMIFDKLDFGTAAKMLNVSKYWSIIKTDETFVRRIVQSTSRFLQTEWAVCAAYHRMLRMMEKEFPMVPEICNDYTEKANTFVMDMPYEHHADVYGFNDEQQTLICKRVEGNWFLLDLTNSTIRECDEPAVLAGKGRFIVSCFPTGADPIYFLITESGLELISHTLNYHIPQSQFACASQRLYEGVFLYNNGVFIALVDEKFYCFDVNNSQMICSKKFERGHPEFDEFASFATSPTHFFYVCQFSGLYAISLQELVYDDKSIIDIASFKHITYLERDGISKWYFGRSFFDSECLALCKESQLLVVNIEQGKSVVYRTPKTQLKSEAPGFSIISCEQLERQMSEFCVR